MSLVSTIFKKSTNDQVYAVPLTRVQRLQKEIDECDEKPVVAFNRAFTCGMSRVTEINDRQKAMVDGHKAGLMEVLAEIQSS